MKTFELKLEERKEISKKARRQAIADRKVLGNIYGSQGKSTAVQGDYREIQNVLKEAGKNHPIKLAVGGDSFDALVHEVEQDPITQKLHHVTFRSFKAGETLTVEVPVHIIGDAPASKEGLIMVTVRDRLEVETIPSKIPEYFEVDVSNLHEVGDAIRIEDIQVDPDYQILEEGHAMIVRIDAPRAEEEPEEEDEDVLLEGEEDATSEEEKSEEDGQEDDGDGSAGETESSQQKASS